MPPLPIAALMWYNHIQSRRKVKAMKYTIVDYDAWARREVFEFFSGVLQPFYSVTYRLDVTPLYDFAHRHGVSFYLALTYLVTQAINSVEAFHYAPLDGKLVRLERRMPSFTDLRPGSENFHIVTIPADGDILEFCRAAKAKSAAQTQFIDMTSEGADLIFISSLPWLDLTALTNERDFDRDDAVPRIAWGRFVDEGGRKVLGMSLELNHRFVDGFHIGLFNDSLTRFLKAL